MRRNIERLLPVSDVRRSRRSTRSVVISDRAFRSQLTRSQITLRCPIRDKTARSGWILGNPSLCRFVAPEIDRIWLIFESGKYRR
jgi:hypothetical protein